MTHLFGNEEQKQIRRFFRFDESFPLHKSIAGRGNDMNAFRLKIIGEFAS